MLHNVSDNWDRVVLKLINANPGLKVNRINFLSSMKLLFTSYLLCKLKDKQHILLVYTTQVNSTFPAR